MKKIFFIICLIFLFSSLQVYAQLDISPKIEICSDNSVNCEFSTDILEIENSKELFFKITIVNEGTHGWLCFEQSICSLNIEHKTIEIPKSLPRYIFSSENNQGYCIPPNEKLIFYVPFDKYNNLDEENRLTDWKITPEIELKEVVCYEDSSFEKTNKCFEGYSSSLSATGNRLKLDVVKDLPSTHPRWDKSLKIIKSGWGIVVSIVVVLAAFLGILSYFQTNKKKKYKRKRRR